MKKLLIVIFFVIFTLTVFTACSAMPNDGYYEFNDADTMLTAPTGADKNYQYEEIVEQGFVNASQNASSYFSLDRNTASYALMRSQIQKGLTVNKGSVRLEEYVNYFNYGYPRPTDGNALALGGSIFDTPYNSDTKLFTISVSAEEVEMSNTPNNIVFLIDSSGSMYGDDRLGLIQQSFAMLLDYLGEDDTISIVTYASGVRTLIAGEKGANKTKIANVLFDLEASGSTNGSGGIQLAYDIATQYFIEGGNNRVILATDGDFNVGISDKEQLKEFISQKRDNGIYLSVLGVGMYNTNDTTLSTLANNGNGNYAFLDTVAEAYKVLVAELNGTFNVVAKDAKIGVTFNHEVVESYRLIGYESKVMSEEEFEDTNKDAGEIGSGHTVTAVYELKLTSDDRVLKADEVVATAEVKYKHPTTNEDKSITKIYTVADYTDSPNEDAVFIGCVVEFGLILRQSEYKANASFTSIVSRLQSLECVADDQFKAEFLTIVQKAQQSKNYGGFSG